MNCPKVSIIILNWKGWEDTIECLESLYQITYPNYDVIVVDNSSEDESIEKIKRYAEGEIKVDSKLFKYNPSNKPIKIIEYTRGEAETGGGKENEIVDLSFNRKMVLIKNEKNYGFAEGNNIAMRYALKALNPDYVLLLNNDTVVDKEFLGELVKVGESDEKIGVVGPKIYYYDFKGRRVELSGAKILFWMGGIPIGSKDTDQIKNVDMVSGCCMLIKKEIIKITGMLDPVYFFGWEDADFCTKTKKLGYNVMCTQKRGIWHKIGASYGGYYASNPRILREGIRNQLIFISRHAHILQKIFSTPFLIRQAMHVIFWRSNSISEIKIKIAAIKNGFVDFIEYKRALRKHSQ